MAYNLRVKCPSCGNVEDITAARPCKKCGAMLDPELPAMLKIYRMGNFIGSAVGYGIYINEAPYGHVGDRQTVNIRLPYGNYKLHMTAGMNRKCNDLQFTLTPEQRLICVKAHLKMGAFTNTVVVEQVSPDTMPE